MKFILKGGMISGKNQQGSRFQNGRRILFPNKNFVTWRNIMSKQIWQQRCGLQPLFTEPVFLFVHYYPKDKLRRDATGILDALFHLLERTNVLLDDALVKAMLWKEWPVDRADPRVQIDVELMSKVELDFFGWPKEIKCI